MRAVAVLRVVSALEGLSYLLLVFVAMPLKYGFGWPLGVRVSGMGHGWLFIAFVAALVWAAVRRRWSPLRAATLFALSLVPFGFVVIERRLREESDDAAAGERADSGAPSEA